MSERFSYGTSLKTNSDFYHDWKSVLNKNECIEKLCQVEWKSNQCGNQDGRNIEHRNMINDTSFCSDKRWNLFDGDDSTGLYW